MQTSPSQSRWHALATRLAYEMERYHVGAENAVSAAELMEYLELTNDRDLRSVVQYAVREMRLPIVSTFDGGYCVAAGYSDDAYLHCIAQRKEVARSNFEAAAAVNAAMESRYGEPTLFEVG